MNATLDDWFAREVIRSSIDLPGRCNPALDSVIASLEDSVELLGFGEALHGGEEVLILRNRLLEQR